MVPGWMTSAKCLDADVDCFYLQARFPEARALCAACPVRRECLEFALQRLPTQDYGLWGGTTASERARVRRRGLPVETAAEVLDTILWSRASEPMRASWVPLAPDLIAV